jgi:hypothetical protein
MFLYKKFYRQDEEYDINVSRVFTLRNSPLRTLKLGEVNGKQNRKDLFTRYVSVTSILILLMSAKSHSTAGIWLLIHCSCVAGLLLVQDSVVSLVDSQDDSLCGTTGDFPDIRASNCGGRRAPARRDAAAGGTSFY